MIKLIGEIIGIIAMVESLAIYAVQKRRNILLLKLISNVLWGTNNLLLGLETGAVLWLIAIVREIVYLFRPRYKWADNKAWIAVFIVLSLCSPTIEWLTLGFSVISILPAVGSLFNVVGGYCKSPLRMRLILLPAETLWITYAIFERNVSLIISEAFLIVSAIVGIVIELSLHRRSNAAKELDEPSAPQNE